MLCTKHIIKSNIDDRDQREVLEQSITFDQVTRNSSLNIQILYYIKCINWKSRSRYSKEIKENNFPRNFSFTFFFSPFQFRFLLFCVFNDLLYNRYLRDTIRL